MHLDSCGKFMMMSMLACAWSFEALNAAILVSADVRSKEPEHDVSCNGFPLCVSARLRMLAVGCVPRFGARNLRTMLVATLSCMVFWFASQVPRLRTLPASCVQRFGARNLRMMFVATLSCMVFLRLRYSDSERCQLAVRRFGARNLRMILVVTLSCVCVSFHVELI